MKTNKDNKCDRSVFSLAQPITYQITIAGHIDENWPGWLGIKVFITEFDPEGYPNTIITGKFDQAALIGLMRQLYSLGYPLISVICVDPHPNGNE